MAAREFCHGLLADDVEQPARQWRGRDFHSKKFGVNKQNNKRYYARI
jgi:hypothetical protein